MIRVPDPATGVNKPRWVGGFDTEDAAKAARDEARVRARRGEYVNRSASTLADYLSEWLDSHASTVKPKTLAGYRHDIDHYIVPRIGRMRLQALRPAVISKLYRDLAEHGGRDGRPLSSRRSPTSTARCARRWPTRWTSSGSSRQPGRTVEVPKNRRVEPVQIWTVQQLASFLTTARSHRLFAFYRLAAYTGARRGELLHLRWNSLVNLDVAEVTFSGSTAVVRRLRVEGTTKGRPVSHRQP